MTELYQVIPSSIPKPLAHGKFVTEEPPIHFLLSEYVDMTKDNSDPEILCAKIVELHRKSVSPKGKFGFKVWTCNGRTPQAVEWDDSWTSLFRKMMIHVLAEDIKANGRWPEYERVGKTIFSDVIPRLIGALERDVRGMEPCLVQGDLWEGNTGISNKTGEIMLFDAGSYYAHNEMESRTGVACMTRSTRKPTQEYIRGCGGA